MLSDGILVSSIYQNYLRRPHELPDPKVTPKVEARIMHLRTEHNLGSKRIQGELMGEELTRLSFATICCADSWVRRYRYTTKSSRREE